MNDDVMRRDRRVGPDGTVTETVTMNLGRSTPLRPVRDDVVSAVDTALGRLGPVMHAMDPSRLVSFLDGGPPVWSVGLVEVAGPTPYTLLVTYGLSHVLSPEEFRRGITHEYSIAIPAGTPLAPWADAFLRHQCRYVLSQRADIRVGDCVPFRGVPLTRIAFQPQHHASLPDSTLVGIVATNDPVLPRIDTPAGPIEVRRLVGVDAAELDRIETWSVLGFVEELLAINPLLLSPIHRGSAMDYPAFAERVNARAAEEGSALDAAVFEVAWQVDGPNVVLTLPSGRARARLIAGIRGRVGFGRRLLAISMHAPPIAFEPTQPASVRVDARSLVIGGGLDGPAGTLLAALERGESRVRV